MGRVASLDSKRDEAIITRPSISALLYAEHWIRPLMTCSGKDENLIGYDHEIF